MEISPRFYPAAFYFLYFAGMAALLPFLSIYYQEMGLSGQQIGTLLALTPLITLFAAPVWTGWADSAQRHRLALTIAMLGMIVMVLVISQLQSFALLLPVVVIYAIFSAPTASLVDSATMSMLGPERASYGRLRVWGTVGWAITAPLVGALVGVKGLIWVFGINAILNLLALLFSRRIPFNATVTSVSFSSGMRTMFANRRWILFLALVFAGGMGLASINSFLSLYLAQLGASKTLIGLSLTISTFSELPVMYFGSWFLRRFGARGLLLSAIFVTGLRALLTSLAGSPVAILFVQLIHGLTFPAIWLAGVAYADEHAPVGMSATAQGMFGGALMGLGAGAGSFVGGILMQQFGLPVMYRCFGIFVLICPLFYLLLERWVASRAEASAAPVP